MDRKCSCAGGRKRHASLRINELKNDSRERGETVCRHLTEKQSSFSSCNRPFGRKEVVRVL